MTILLILIFLLMPLKISHAQEWEKLSITNDYISSIEKSPWGILIGEKDQRLWQNPFNGIYISKDFGKSFTELGLHNKGITEIKYFDQKIYATTYYFTNEEAGLFVSEDRGVNWRHLGENFSATSIDRNEHYTLLGTYDHGLWVSSDEGLSWIQYFGDGFYGETIDNVFVTKKGYFAAVNGDIYFSENTVEWQKIQTLTGSNVKYLLEGNEVLIASGNGMFKSIDGINWQALDALEGESSGPITFFDGNFYLSSKNPQTLSYEIFESKDQGESWVDLEMPNVYNEGLANSIEWVFANPSFLLTAVPMEGVYKYFIPNQQTENPLLNVPWQNNYPSELVENIFSFFDHAFPFLGYYFFNEPNLYESSTTNYFGITETEPKFYYSSHDGIDFALPYGTPVLAAADGLAAYGFDSEGLGHYLTINHQNGYKTTYAHLQQNGLVTNSNVYVSERQQLGYVGMSGNTTGPHLHFAVEKTNSPKPENRVDPFGWQNKLTKDPWENFYWMDSLGSHLGSKSFNLWKVDPKYNFLTNKQLIIESNSSDQNFTVFIEPYIYPKIPITQNKLTYITGTSMLINAYNMLGQKIPELFQPAKIEIDISNANLENILENTIKIYKWNEEEKIWKPIPSFYDSVNKIVQGETLSFSKFAVFGIDVNAWKDKAEVFNTNLQTL